MKISRVLKNLGVLFSLLLFLISCGSQDESPTATPVEQVTSSATAASTPVEPLPTELPTVEPTMAPEPLYSLDWKLADEEIIAYKTAMEPGENTNTAMSFNFDQLFAETDAPNGLRDQLANITFPDTFSMVTILQKNSLGNISVKLIVDEIEEVENEAGNPIGNTINQMMGDMEGTVQLRGELTPEGTIASFYLEQNQRNLLAMLFELPSAPVHVGDSWEIDVNCVAMGHGFIASNANRVNKVTLTSVEENDEGQALAHLEYVIAESVEGDFLFPFSEEPIPTSMNCSFLGQGSFLIEEGRWQQFNGEFRILATGMVESNTVQQFALAPLEDVPQEYIDLK